MSKVKKIIHIALLTVIIFPFHGQAQQFQRPEPINNSSRFMPGFGSESLVKARYTVKADGTVDDIELIDYVSNRFLNTMLRDSVKDWSFTPGMMDGEAVDFYNQEWLFSLRVDPNAPAVAPGFGPGGPPAPVTADQEDAGTNMPGMNVDQAELPLALSEEFKEEIVEIYELLAQQDLDAANKQVTRLLRKDFLTVFDFALSHELKANILMARNDIFEALDASILATMSARGPQGDNHYFLTDDALELGLKRRFLLALSARQNQLAWDTYEELSTHFEIPAEDQIHEQAVQAKALLDSPEPLQLIAKIVDKQWTYKPARRIFTVTNIDGKLSEIEARCERRNLELKYQENVDWTLPASLGECVLDFKGRKGTQFVVYEFAE